MSEITNEQLETIKLGGWTFPNPQEAAAELLAARGLLEKIKGELQNSEDAVVDRDARIAELESRPDLMVPSCSELSCEECNERTASLLARISELEETDNACGEIHHICMDLGIPAGHVVDRVRLMAGRLAELEADRDALDFVEAKRLPIIPCYGLMRGGMGSGYSPPFEGYIVDPQDQEPKPLREAIRTARGRETV